jgi:hypothetical protein
MENIVRRREVVEQLTLFLERLLGGRIECEFELVGGTDVFTEPRAYIGIRPAHQTDEKTSLVILVPEREGSG